MKFLKLLVALVATFLAEPLAVSALLTEFPVGSQEKVLNYATRIDSVGFVIRVYDSNGEFVAEIYNHSFSGIIWPNGNREFYLDIARRSRDELAKAIEQTMRWILRDTLQQSGKGDIPPLEGKRLVFYYNGWKEGPFYLFFAAKNKFRVTKDADGNLTVPEEAYKVDLVADVMGGRNIWVAVPGIKGIRVVVTDTKGQVLTVLKGYSADEPEYDSDNGVTVFQKWDLTTFPLRLAVSGTPGEIRIWYTNGSEQVFNLSNGENLITYLSPPLAQGSPFKRLGVPKVTGKGIELPYEAADDEQVLIKRANANFSAWEPLYYLPVYPPVVPTGTRTSSGPLPVRIRTATAPRDSGFGFYKAEVVSPVAPAAPKQQ